MRGQLSIFNDFIASSTVPEDSLSEKERKGRNEALHHKRNELLIHRYYYHIRIRKRQYLDTLQILEQDEFFLTERTIIDIITKDKQTLRELHQQQPEVRYFRKKYPHWVW